MNIYRCFDENGLLLYVGKTLCSMKRIRMHKTNSKWFAEVRSVIIEPCKSKNDARKKEALAIIIENPKYNVIVPVIYFAPKTLVEADKKWKDSTNRAAV